MPTPLSEARRERREKMRQVWVDIADNSTNEFARISAAEKWLDREEGKPSQTINVRKIGALSDLTDEELAALEADAAAKAGR